MKALSSIPKNILTGQSYDADGRFILTSLWVGEQFLYIPAENDTACAVVPATQVLTQKGVFTAVTDSVTLMGKAGAKITAVVAWCQPVNLFESEVTPQQPARQVTMNYTNAANPRWSRSVQISNEYLFIKRGTLAVAIPLEDIINLGMTMEVDLTWTPPIIKGQPASAAGTVGQPVDFVFTVGSEYNVTYHWEQTVDGGKTWTPVSDGAEFAGSNTAKLTVTPPAAGVINLRCTATDDVSEFKEGAANGSVTSHPAKLEVE